MAGIQTEVRHPLCAMALTKVHTSTRCGNSLARTSIRWPRRYAGTREHDRTRVNLDAEGQWELDSRMRRRALTHTGAVPGGTLAVPGVVGRV